MESNLSVIQTEIAKALEQLKNKALVTEADLAKKIRLNTKFVGKPKAGISLNDIESAILFLQETQSIFYSVHCNSANDLFFKKEDSQKELDASFRHRRLKSEKNMTILTSNDMNNVNSKNEKHKQSKKSMHKRTERKNMYIYGDYESLPSQGL